MAEHTERYRHKTICHIEALEEYVLVAQEKMEVTVFRRANQCQPEIIREASDTLQLHSLEFSLLLSAVYEGVKV